MASRSDLLDRAIRIQLPHIPPDERTPRRDLEDLFERYHAEILGGILTATSEALKNRNKITLDSLPRMADFAVWVTAGEPALPWEDGAFLQVYETNLAESVETALENDLVAPYIVSFMKTKEVWTGSAGELLGELGQAAPERATRSQYWPQTPAAMALRLSRVAPLLRSEGILG